MKIKFLKKDSILVLIGIRIDVVKLVLSSTSSQWKTHLDVDVGDVLVVGLAAPATADVAEVLQ
jgi:hypothetical protein